MKYESLFAAALLGIAPALYTVNASAVDGYVTQRYNDDAPLRTRYGECVHDGLWQPGNRYRDCEPAPVAAPEQPATAPAPAPVVEAPAPAPAPKPMVLNQPFKLSTETFFAFGSSELKPEGRKALDDLANQLAISNYEAVAIVGHADRIGSTAYNQKLSERRASAMREYLIEKGVPADRISATGLGEANPTARCGPLRGARLIACLQPDRYAQLTVSGTVEVSAADAQ